MSEIDEDTRLKLIGLKALADEHASKMDDIYRAICRTLGFEKEDDTGVISDWLWADAGETIDQIIYRTAHHREEK